MTRAYCHRPAWEGDRTCHGCGAPLPEPVKAAWLVPPGTNITQSDKYIAYDASKPAPLRVDILYGWNAVRPERVRLITEYWK